MTYPVQDGWCYDSTGKAWAKMHCETCVLPVDAPRTGPIQWMGGVYLDSWAVPCAKNQKEADDLVNSIVATPIY